MASGSPRSLAIRSSTRRTRNPPSDIDLDGRTCPGATVHDGQHPNHPPGGHAITHQIHRPTFIRPRGGWASYRAPPADPPPLPNPHRPTFLAVEPIRHWLTSIHQKPF